jgi:hypothetical protein
MQDNGLRSDLLKPDRNGKGVDKRTDEDDGRSSPRRHWPQKAVVAHAATATSKGSLRSRRSTSCSIIAAFTGGRGRRFEPWGARLWTPLSTYLRRVLPFHSVLCATCHTFKADKWLRGVLRECTPALEAAKAHRTNSSAGKRRWLGTPSASQNCMNCLIAPE